MTIKPIFLAALVSGPTWLFTPSNAFGQLILPRPDHVVIVVEENKVYENIIGKTEAPYINALAQQGALFTSSHGVGHPSQENYLTLFSGSKQGVGDDSCPHHFSTPNLASELLDKGFSFMGFSESMPSIGYTGCGSGGYARKHNPWVNFSNVPHSLNLPFNAFPSDFNELPDVCFVVPNLNHDMHDGTVRQGDDWLRQHIDPYVQWAQTHQSLLVLTWDEGGSGNHIVTLMVGPMVRPGLYDEPINHNHVLRTLLDMFGLQPMAGARSVDPITDVWTDASVNVPILVALTHPAAGDLLTNTTSTILTATAEAEGADVIKVEFFNHSIKLGESTSAPFTYTWSPLDDASPSVVAVATDSLGRRKASVPVPFQVVLPESIPPGIAITSPKTGSRITSDSLQLEGTASDNTGLDRVEYRLGEAPYQTATGTAHWSAAVTLAPGPNTFTVRSVDLAGNLSRTAYVTVTYVVTSSLNVQIEGQGRVSPDLNGQSLEVGKSYQLKATPGAGQVFAGWSGDPTQTAPSLRFTMQPNLVLKAVFVPNPFAAVAGIYKGLVRDAGMPAFDHYELVKFRVDTKGTVTGIIWKNGGKQKFRTRLNGAGRAELWLPTGRHAAKRSKAGVTTNLLMGINVHLEPGANLAEGELNSMQRNLHTGETALVETQGTFSAGRMVFNANSNPAPWTGQYTIALTPPDDGEGLPDGVGTGLVTITPDGSLHFSGTLADGTKVSQITRLTSEGICSIFIPMDKGRSLLAGQWYFLDTPLEFTGYLDWWRSAQPQATYYPAGFSNQWVVIGSRIDPADPATSDIEQSTAFTVVMDGGGLSEPWTNHVVLDAQGMWQTLEPDTSSSLAFAFNPKNGLVYGMAQPPSLNAQIIWKGVMLPHLQMGSGLFLNRAAGTTGKVLILPPESP